MPAIVSTDETVRTFTPSERAAVRNGEPEHAVRFPVSPVRDCRAFLRVTRYSQGRPDKVELVTTWTRILGRFYCNAPRTWQFVPDPSVGQPTLNAEERMECARLLRDITPGGEAVPTIVWPDPLAYPDRLPQPAKPIGPTNLGQFLNL